jgi:regulator of sigma D
MTEEKQRTIKQNASLHQWCEMLATALNECGLTVEKTLTGKAEILWSKVTVKEILFKQIMKLQTGKTSTTELTTKELCDVSESLTKYLSENHDLVVDFPSLESQIMNERINASN